MSHARENSILYRRFLAVALLIAVLGLVLAQTINATQRSQSGLTVHDRALGQETNEFTKLCPAHFCHLLPELIG